MKIFNRTEKQKSVQTGVVVNDNIQAGSFDEGFGNPLPTEVKLPEPRKPILDFQFGLIKVVVK
jgi:hypothetical protein